MAVHRDQRKAGPLSDSPRYFGLTELGRKLFGFEKAVDGRRAHWMKLPLDFFNHPTVLSLPDSQRLPLIGVGLLCIRRDNSVQLDARSVRRALNLRVAPDFDLYIAQGLIQLHSTSKTSDSVRGEEREEKRGGRGDDVAYVPPPDVQTETAIRAGTVALERRLLQVVGVLSGRLNRDAMGVMRQVTAYKRGDTIIPGRSNPSGLTSERLEKSIADAEGWLADLDAGKAVAQ